MSPKGVHFGGNTSLDIAISVSNSDRQWMLNISVISWPRRYQIGLKESLRCDPKVSVAKLTVLVVQSYRIFILGLSTLPLNVGKKPYLKYD